MTSIKGKMSEKLDGVNEKIKSSIVDSFEKLPIGETIKTTIKSELQQVTHLFSYKTNIY